MHIKKKLKLLDKLINTNQDLTLIGQLEVKILEIEKLLKKDNLSAIIKFDLQIELIFLKEFSKNCKEFYLKKGLKHEKRKENKQLQK